MLQFPELEQPQPMKVYTVAEAAKILKVSQETVRRWARSGKLKGINPGKGWRFTDKDIRRFLGQDPRENKK